MMTLSGKNHYDFPKKKNSFFAAPNVASNWRSGIDMHTDPTDQKRRKKKSQLKTNLEQYASI